MQFKPSSKENFLSSFKNQTNNGITKFLILGGAAASFVNGFHNFFLTGTLESLGIGVASWVASRQLNGKPVGTMNNQELNSTITKGAFLGIGGAILGGLINMLPLIPQPITNVLHYPTSIAVLTGLIIAGEAIYHKSIKPKM